MSSARIQIWQNCIGFQEYPLMLLGMSIFVLIILCPFILYRLQIFLQGHYDTSFVTGEEIYEPSISKMWRSHVTVPFFILALLINGINYSMCLVQAWFIVVIWLFLFLTTLIYCINPDPPNPNRQYSNEELNRIRTWRMTHAILAGFLFTLLVILSAVMSVYYYQWSPVAIVLLSLMSICWIVLVASSWCLSRPGKEFQQEIYNEIWSWNEFGLASFFCFFVAFIPAVELVPLI